MLTYALVGSALPFFYRCRARTVFTWCIGLLVFVFMISVLLSAPAEEKSERAWSDIGRQLAERALYNYGQGSFGDAVSQRLVDLAFTYGNALVYFPVILVMFLLGVYAGKTGLLQDLLRRSSFLRRVATVSFAFGLPLGILQEAAAEQVRSDVATFYDSFISAPIF
ncbi:hypothetical protein BSNK01_32000 [Bacillaceae bacterium]